MVDNLSNATSEQCCITSMVEPNSGSSDVMNMDVDGRPITTLNVNPNIRLR